jgi:hypothetical protein
MNIKGLHSTTIHIQSKNNVTLCGIKLERRQYNPTNRAFESSPYFVESNDIVSCEKCLEKKKKMVIK